MTSFAATPTPDGRRGRFLHDPWSVIDDALHIVREWLVAWWPLTGVVLVLAAGVLGAARRWRRRAQHRRLLADARVVTILPPPSVDPDGATALWANLVGLLRPAWRRTLSGQPHLAFEYVFDRHTVRIRVWTPGVVPPGLVERAVQAAWPGAHTRTTPAPAPETSDRRQVEAVGAQLRLARAEALPIKTDFPTDPVRALLAAPAGLGPHDHAIVQVLARPVTGRRVRRAHRAARHLHAGRAPHLVGRLLDLATPGPTRKRTTGLRSPLEHQVALAHAAQDRAIVTKLRGPQYETRIRYAITTPHDPTDSVAVRDRLRGRAHGIGSAFAAYSEHNYYRRRRLRHPARAVAARRLDTGDLLSVPELAAIAHLPTDQTVPGLQRAGARAVPAPPGLALTGPDVKPLGRTDSGHTQPVGLRVADARHHVHILGATGSGKSELMARMILHDADHGRGLVVIDPKGDLVTDLLTRLPAHLGDKVVLFDTDSRATPCLNPLEGHDRERTVDNLVSIFSRIYAASWGPRTDDILRASLLTLTQLPGTPTLTDLPKLLTVPAFRHRAVDHIHDDVLAGFWTWYSDLSDPARAQVIAPLMNKIRGLLLRPFVRAAIAAGPSTVDLDQVLNQGGLCLVRIAKDALGMDTARLIGSIIVARTWQATTRRARTPQPQRPDASLYLDECHQFLNLAYPLEDMLAEARGYRLSITLAHQHLRQLPRELEEGISTNARTKIYFATSPEDARTLARHTTPQLDEHDLAHLDVFHAAARLVLHGQQAPACTLTTDKLPPPIPGRARHIRRAARVHTQPRPPEPAPHDTGRPVSDARRTP